MLTVGETHGVFRYIILYISICYEMKVELGELDMGHKSANPQQQGLVNIYKNLMDLLPIVTNSDFSSLV